MDYAVKMGMIPDNPCRNVTVPKMDKKEIDCYSLEEAAHFLKLLEQEPLKYQAFFQLAIFGGFRRGELLGLEWKDIDFDTCLVSVRRTSQYTKAKGVYTDTTKTESSKPVSYTHLDTQVGFRRDADKLAFKGRVRPGDMEDELVLLRHQIRAPNPRRSAAKAGSWSGRRSGMRCTPYLASSP